MVRASPYQAGPPAFRSGMAKVACHGACLTTMDVESWDSQMYGRLGPTCQRCQLHLTRDSRCPTKGEVRGVSVDSHAVGRKRLRHEVTMARTAGAKTACSSLIEMEGRGWIAG